MSGIVAIMLYCDFLLQRNLAMAERTAGGGAGEEVGGEPGEDVGGGGEEVGGGAIFRKNLEYELVKNKN